jgi:16S rRNA (adenine1518-N6/adenine1519-N6)-dimethyltransferase
MNNRQTITFLTRRFREAGIQPDTRHGQNFLIDLNLVRLLADSARLEPRDVVLEVGTGTGSLTQLLAQRAGAVVSVEISQELHQLASEELVDYDNVTLLQLDALKNKNRFHPAVLDTLADRLRAVPDGRPKLVANLPYNIATPVISNLLLTDVVPHSMNVTIQKELADRITAGPGSKDYGALSVWIQSQCDASVIRVLPPSVFWPRPKVESTILQLLVRPERRRQIANLPFLNSFLRSLFLHRRKFLRSGLMAAWKKRIGKDAVDEVLREMDFGPDARAEQLAAPQLLDLCERIRRRVEAAEGAAPAGGREDRPQASPPGG